jgi:hypothetical protein
VQDIHDGVAEARLEQPVLRSALDVEPGSGQSGRRQLGVVLRDHHVDVVHGFGRAVDPQRVAASECEAGTVFPQRGQRGPHRASQLFVLRRHRR